VPTELTWAQGREPFRLSPEARRAPDHARWLANLRESGARYVVVSGIGDECTPVPEQAWCRDDTSHFEFVAEDRCATAWRVRDWPAAPARPSHPETGR